MEIAPKAKYPLSGHLPDSFLESRDELGNTLLIQAISGNDLEFMEELLERGANKEADGNEGFTPLAAAAYLGYVDAAKILIKYRVDVNAHTEGDDIQRSPLGWAAACGHAEMAQLLLDAGAHVDDRDSELNTPLIVAAALGKETVIPILLEHCANPKLVGRNGFTASRAAASIGRGDIVDLLFRHLANVTRFAAGAQGEKASREHMDDRFHLLGIWADSALLEAESPIPDPQVAALVQEKKFTYLPPSQEELRAKRMAFYQKQGFLAAPIQSPPATPEAGKMNIRPRLAVTPPE